MLSHGNPGGHCADILKLGRDINSEFASNTSLFELTYTRRWRSTSLGDNRVGVIIT